MSIESQFTPEQIKDLIDGKTVSFAKEDCASPGESNKKESKLDVPEGGSATSFSPRVSIKIDPVERVSSPNILNSQGVVVSRAEDRIPGPSETAFDNLDHARIQAEAEVQAQREAEKELARVASPEQLLNQLNGLRRIVDKQQKEIRALTRERNAKA